MPKIAVNDINIYYEIHGEGPPLILIYGLGGRGSFFHYQIEDLSARFSTIIFDNRGVGETDQPEEPYSIRQMADDAAALLGALGLESAGVFGISMGGMIAQELALSYPKLVSKLALGCTHCGIRHCEPSPPWVTELFKTLPGMPRSQSVRASIPFNYSPHTRKYNPERIEEFIDLSVVNLQRKHAYINQLQAVYQFDTFDRLPQINIPVLVLTGKDDALITPTNSKMLCEKIPGAQLLEFDNAGHLFYVEQPEELNRALVEFFS